MPIDPTMIRSIECATNRLAAHCTPKGDGMKMDSYAFGCCLFEMVAHKPPWQDISLSQVYAEVARGNRPVLDPTMAQQAPAGWCDMMELCWSDNPEDRPGFSAMYAQLCLLYTSDAADEEDSVDLGGGRIIKKKKLRQLTEQQELFVT
eukprot:TRINITY_DN11204_c0_g1_i1.p2 TRINITY_DN11204_c0_g1~~TRINITY_DN11204_c0_g1_i1.p2  ORF type:complete len:148 (-),score=32.93 TRINITY_DN11204_c0_g1_i1:74-517(-)